MAQIITNSNGGGAGGGGSGDMLKSVYDPHNINADAFDYDNFTNTPDLSGYQTTSNLVTDLTNPDDTHYPSAKAVSDAITSAGGGDMLKSVYDPNNVAANAFDYNNFTNTPDLSDYVDGPASSTDEDVAVFDGVTGKIIKDSGVKLSSKLDASALSDNNYGGAWENDSTHTPTKRVLYDKIHTMDVEIGNKAADTAVVKLTGNQTINGTKTFGTSPVVPSKTADATNTGTAIATEAQVYKKQDALTLPATPTQGNLVVRGADNETLADGGAVPTTPSKATSSALGTIKLGSDTVQSVSAEAVSGTANRTYAIQLNSSDQAVVNVPWENTTYSNLAAASGGADVSLVTTGDKYNWNNKVDGPSSATNNHLAVFDGTTGKLIKDGGAVPTGVPSGGNNGDVLTNVSGTPTWSAPSGGVQMSTITVTLTTAGWSSKSQTVSVSGVTASNTVIVSPAPASINDYASNSVYCESQGSGTLTFKCNTVPGGDISVNVLILS